MNGYGMGLMNGYGMRSHGGVSVLGITEVIRLYVSYPWESLTNSCRAIAWDEGV